LDETATKLLNCIDAGGDGHSKPIGMNHLERMYDSNTRLDAAEADAVFSTWYNKERKYIYGVEPSNYDAGKFNVHYRNFIIIFLELLVNSHIKY